MSPFPGLDELRFYGIGGVECEDFIVTVRRLARTLGKENEPTWVAQMVSVCCEEDALRWHISLDDDVKGDWRQLEMALIQSFPAPETRESRFYTMRTTPAAAAANLVPVFRTGRLKIIRDDGVLHGYISKTLNISGFVKATTSIEEALLVKYSTSDQLKRLLVENVTGDWKMLGVCWTTTPTAGSSSDLAALDFAKDGAGSVPSWPIRSTNVWRVASDDEITGQWTPPGAQDDVVFPLHSRLWAGNNLIRMAAVESAYITGTVQIIKLVFEECN